MGFGCRCRWGGADTPVCPYDRNTANQARRGACLLPGSTSS